MGLTIQHGATSGPTIENCVTGQSWMESVTAWLCHEPLESVRFDLPGKIVKQSVASALVRFDHEGAPVLWYKSPLPGSNELAVTSALTRECADCILPILAVHHPSDSFVTRNVCGIILGRQWELGAWKAAVRTLARIQVRWTDRASDLLAMGCRDLRPPASIKAIMPYLEIAKQSMAAQPKEPPRRLLPNEMDQLGEAIERAYEQLMVFHVPCSLCHWDSAPHNFVVTDMGKVRILDWHNAYLGHPFMTFENLLARMKKLQPWAIEWEEDLRCTYAAEWSGILPENHVAPLYALTRTLAIFDYALARYSGRDPAFLVHEGGPRTRSLMRLLHNQLVENARSPSFCEGGLPPWQQPQ